MAVKKKRGRDPTTAERLRIAQMAARVNLVLAAGRLAEQPPVILAQSENSVFPWEEAFERVNQITFEQAQEAHNVY